MFGQIFILSFTVTILSAAPAALNTAGAPNTQCTLQDSISTERFKAITCLLETVVMEPMKDPSIPSFDVFRLKSLDEFDAYNAKLKSCNCNNPLWNTREYSSTVSYEVDTHITIRRLYDPRINQDRAPANSRQYLPEDILDEEGQSAPVNTQWILKDHINSLRGFIDYYTPARHIAGGDKLAAIAKKLSSIISNYTNFQFSNDCPADTRNASFNGFTNSSCEFQCANWHFNHTINGFYFALGNEAIYPSASNPTQPSDPYPERTTWLEMECCNVGPLEALKTGEYRNLTCGLEKLNFQTFKVYEIFEKEIEQPIVTCPENISTVSGIKTWDYYIQSGLFPPYKWSKTANMYIYSSHIAALKKHQSDLLSLRKAIDENRHCFDQSAVNTTLNGLIDVLHFVVPLADKWLIAHNCPYCSSCANSTVPSPKTDTFTGCPSSMEVLCLMADIGKVSESIWMYLITRAEAITVWDESCFQFI